MSAKRVAVRTSARVSIARDQRCRSQMRKRPIAEQAASLVSRFVTTQMSTDARTMKTGVGRTRRRVLIPSMNQSRPSLIPSRATAKVTSNHSTKASTRSPRGIFGSSKEFMHTPRRYSR